MRYWIYQMTTCPSLPQVSVDESTEKIVGYVLAKMEEEKEEVRLIIATLQVLACLENIENFLSPQN